MPDAQPTPPDPAAPAGPKLRVAGADAARPGLTARFRGWARQHAAGERTATFLRSLLWVAPLTALIWVYAERQQQFTMPGVTLPIEVVSSDPNKVARLLRPTDGNVMVTLRGPKAAIDALLEQTRAGTKNSAVLLRIDRTGGGGPGEQDVTFRAVDRIGEDRRFADAGITIVGAQPETIQVQVEPIVARSVVVKARLPQQFAAAGVAFDPPDVRVRGPASVVGDPADPNHPQPRVEVYAELESRIDAASPPQGGKELVLPGVKLSLPSGVRDVTLEPATVTARVRPTGEDRTTIPSVRVRIGAAADVMRAYTVDPPPPITDVKVIGPPAEIQKLTYAPEVVAMLPAALPDQPTGGDVEARLLYDLPPGVRVEENGGPKTLRVRVTRNP